MTLEVKSNFVSKKISGGKENPSKRQLMIAESVKRIVARVVETDSRFDPVARVSITRAISTGDLGIVKIYLYTSAVSDAQMNVIVKFFQEQVPFLRKKIADSVKLKFIPDIMFLQDEFMQNIMTDHFAVPIFLDDSVVV